LNLHFVPFGKMYRCKQSIEEYYNGVE